MLIRCIILKNEFGHFDWVLYELLHSIELYSCGKIVEVVAFKVEELPFDIADFFS
ncbi:MAG: hypothetical protein RL000_1842 [Bacteroidota bacterium]|jgi:hypothetical protein